MVIDTLGEESLYLHRARAEMRAMGCHGTIEELVRMSDALSAVEAARAVLLPLIADRRTT